MTVANPGRPDSSAGPNNCAAGILIFAKAPRPGVCKTRLARGCSSVRAARIYRALTENAVAAACELAPGCVTLLCTPNVAHPFFVRLARRYGVARRRQIHGNLGRRMHAAMRAGLEQHGAVVLMGSDQPALFDHWFGHACNTLGDTAAAWLAPTRDGGYWAIGLSRAEARIFTLRRWSTPRVARETRRAMRSSGLTARLFSVRRDIDDWRDWCQLPHSERTKLARSATLPGSRRPRCESAPGRRARG